MSEVREIRLLHDITPTLLTELAEDRRWPKWSTMCQLRRLGLPVLNGVCITPDHAGDLAHAVSLLVEATGHAQVMVRSDGGSETAAYYRGGNSHPVREVADHAAGLLREGRAVLLLEPTIRYANRLAVLFRMDRDTNVSLGSFTVEALGPGYDVGDLTRGGIRPQVTVTIDAVDWTRFEAPWWADLRVVRDLDAPAEDRRKKQRLETLARSLPGEARDDAERWLREHNYAGLWSGSDPTMRVVRSVTRWFDVAFSIATSHSNRGWRCLAAAASDLGDGRFVYWDVIDGAHKFGSGRFL